MSLRSDLVVLGAVLATAGAAVGLVYWTGHLAGAGAQEAQTALASAQAASGRAEAAAAREAGTILDRGATRAAKTQRVEGENRDAILQPPGAAQRLDADLIAATRRGLCRYDAYAGDPACGLLEPDPAQLSPAGRGDAPDPG